MNEKGFIYPFTLILCLLVCIVIFRQLDAYLIEKRFVYEQERMMQLESLLQVAIVEFKHESSHEHDNYLFSYDSGTVTIEVRDYEDGLSTIFLRATLKTGHDRVAGFQYHWESATVKEYWEVSRHATSILYDRVYGFG